MKDELSVILDLPEEEQYQRLPYYVQPKPWEHISSGSFTPSSCDREYCWKCKKHLRTIDDEESECSVPDGLSESLAALAFRLRDEVGQGHFVNGIIDVFEHLYGYSDYKSVMMWICSEECKSIHFIIAALIVKEMAK